MEICKCPRLPKHFFHLTIDFFGGSAISATGYSQHTGTCSPILSHCSLSIKPFAGNSSSLWLLNFHVIYLELYIQMYLSGGNSTGSPCCRSQAWPSASSSMHASCPDGAMMKDMHKERANKAIWCGHLFYSVICFLAFFFST